MLSDAYDAFALVERLIDGGSGSTASGRSAAASSAPGRRSISPIRQSRLASLNDNAQSGAYMVPRERQREEIASDYYYGGMVVERSASLHPALYYKGLLDACRRRGIAVCADAPVERIERSGAGWRVDDQPRRDVPAMSSSPPTAIPAR